MCEGGPEAGSCDGACGECLASGRELSWKPLQGRGHLLCHMQHCTEAVTGEKT